MGTLIYDPACMDVWLGPDELLVDWKKPPKTKKERLKILQRMAAHAQFCMSGDHTCEATQLAMRDIVSCPADEYFIFVVSDADFRRFCLHA